MFHSNRAAVVKSFALVAFLVLLSATTAVEDNKVPPMVGSSYGGGAAAHAPAPSYGGASIPAPPCPKNYLFSCQPSLSPAPCSQPAPSYGSAGAYSENHPVYALPFAQYVANGYQAY